MSALPARLTVSEGAVLTVTQAAALLGWRGAATWLRAEGLVVLVDGHHRVVWRRVLARLESYIDHPAPPAKRKVPRLADVGE